LLWHLVLSYVWGLRRDTNNKDEAMALWQVLSQALIMNITDLVIFGDSRLYKAYYKGTHLPEVVESI